MGKRITMTVMLVSLVGTTVAHGAEPGLMGWWKFDGDTLDASGNDRHGTLVGDAHLIATGIYGGALSLDGAGDYVTIPGYKGVNAVGGVQQEFTVANWFRTTTTSGDTEMVTWGTNASGQRLSWRVHEGRLRAEHGNGNLRGNTYVNDGEWHHGAVVVAQGANLRVPATRLYADGVEDMVWSGSDNPWTLTANADVSIGRRADNNSRFWIGDIDEVRIYDRVLGADEIKALAARVRAWAPKPANGAQGVTSPVFEWTGSGLGVLYNMYFGTTPELTDADRVVTNQTFNLYFHVQPLVPGMTYYWRVDEIEVDLVTVHTGDVWSFTVAALTAWAPTPADGATSVFPAQTLTWHPGQETLQHHVYFGTSFADVNEGAAAADQGLLTTTQFKTSLLRASTIYFWRVDEVLFDGTVRRGAVWDFTTQAAVQSKIVRHWWTGISGTAVTALTGSLNYPSNPTGTELLDTFEGPSAFTDNYGSRLFGWLTPPASGDYTFWIASDDASELHLSTDADPANATTIAYTTAYTGSREWTKYATQKSAPIALQAGQKYFIEAIQKDGTGGDHVAVSWQGPGIDVQEIIAGRYVDTFAMLPLEAFDPQPADGAVDVVDAPVLNWAAGEKAQKHEVYFGDDPAAVAGADNSSPLFQGSQTTASFEPGTLEWNKTYYWRIDEVGAAESWKGSVWSFTVRNFLVVDDFESYTDEEEASGNRIYQTWIDGWVNNNGATIGNWDPPFAERTIVHGGAQSMPMDYNNIDSPWYSEAERTWAQPQDWTVNGVTDLSLWLRGNPAAFLETGPGAFSISGGGVDIWNTADEFRFAFQRLNGDGTILARVESVLDTHAWAKVGVMIRESLDPTSSFAAVYATPGNGVRYQARLIGATSATSDTPVVTTEQTALRAPVWVKIERAGSTFNGFYSTDGVNWTAMSWNPQTITMAGTVYIGLAVTSHNVNAITIAEFSGVTTTGNVSGPWQAAEIGAAQLDNSQQSLYVTVVDSTNRTAMVVHPDPGAVLATAWTEWKIPLTDLTGVNLAKVKKLRIGVGDRDNPQPDGTGRIYIDDIRIIRDAPVEPNAVVTP